MAKPKSLDTKWNQLTDSFTLSSLLGSGSYGTVILGTNNSTNEQVAIKLIENVFGHGFNKAKQTVSEI